MFNNRFFKRKTCIVPVACASLCVAVATMARHTAYAQQPDTGQGMAQSGMTPPAAAAAEAQPAASDSPVVSQPATTALPAAPEASVPSAVATDAAADPGTGPVQA